MNIIGHLRDHTLRLLAALALAVLLIANLNISASGQEKATFGVTANSVPPVGSSREQDGLVGPVRRVRTETARILTKSGKVVETPRVMLEMTSYDIRGNRIDNAYYMASDSTPTGKEVYKYDERGNITEMTLRGDDGAVLSKEVYTYEFDAVGNWTKMTTSIALIEAGELTSEPTEVAYRTIAYYLTDTMATKMRSMMPITPAIAPPAASGGNEASAATRAAATVPMSLTSSAIKGGEPAPQVNSATVIQTSLPAGADGDYVVPDLVGNAVGNKETILSRGVKPEEELISRHAPKPPVKAISGGVLNGKALSLPPPIYPDYARSAKITGAVSVEVVIDVTGKVSSARATSGPAWLRGPAEQAARRALFSPTLISGQPLKVSGLITYNFLLAR